MVARVRKVSLVNSLLRWKAVLIYVVIALAVTTYVIYQSLPRSSDSARSSNRNTLLWAQDDFGNAIRRPSLRSNSSEFLLNGKKIRLISGAIHYFRIHPSYWREILKKAKACGLNSVETYVPWNLHERVRGHFRWDNREYFLDLELFLSLAHEVGLYVILRPGPYICSEWDLGGLPAWLLRDPRMVLRSSYPGFMNPAKKYLGEVFKRVAKHQYSRGGPIIALQVENELASYTGGSDVQYIKQLERFYRASGIREQLVTSDGLDSLFSLKARGLPKLGKIAKTGYYNASTLVDGLITINLKENAYDRLFQLSFVQPKRPLMVMEYWTGWFDHWSEEHSTANLPQFSEGLSGILRIGASVNFYMFMGGTNFWLMNGANANFRPPWYQPTVTSYDYAAPLSEAGSPTALYSAIRDALTQHVPGPEWCDGPRRNPVSTYDCSKTSEFRLPAAPPAAAAAAYGDVQAGHYATLADVKHAMEKVEAFQRVTEPVDAPVNMENLDVNAGSGQSVGFLLYEATLRPGTKLRVAAARDYGVAMVGGRTLHVLDSTTSANMEFNFVAEGIDAEDSTVVDLLVENLGRVNYEARVSNLPQWVRLDHQRKGLMSSDVHVSDGSARWRHFPMEFDATFLDALDRVRWHRRQEAVPMPAAPMVLKFLLTVDSLPADTYLDMRGWGKGVAVVNGFTLGRYWSVGPQHTLYVPGPLLRTGENTVYVFELSSALDQVTFRDTPVLG